MEKINHTDESLFSSLDHDSPQPACDEPAGKLSDPIQAFRADAMCTAASRNVAMRSVTADLIKTEKRVVEAILDCCQGAPTTIEDLEMCKMAIDLQTRLAKQITQLAQIEVRATDSSLVCRRPR